VREARIFKPIILIQNMLETISGFCINRMCSISIKIVTFYIHWKGKGNALLPHFLNLFFGFKSCFCSL